MFNVFVEAVIHFLVFFDKYKVQKNNIYLK